MFQLYQALIKLQYANEIYVFLAGKLGGQVTTAAHSNLHRDVTECNPWLIPITGYKRISQFDYPRISMKGNWIHLS